MSISRIASGYAQTTSATLSSTPTAGDLILVFAHRDGSNTAPSLATGYTALENAGANTNGMRVAYKYSDGTETTTGTWANATSIGAVVYRNADPQVPAGSFNQNGNTGTSLTFSSITPQVTDGSSWVVACGAHRSATNVNANAPSLTLVGAGVADLGISDSNGGVSSYAGGSQTVNASSGWRTAVVELVAKQSVALASSFVQHVSSASNQNLETGQDFIQRLPNPTGTGNALIVYLTYAFGASRTVTITAKDASGSTVTTTFTARSGPVSDAGSQLTCVGYVAEGITAGIASLTYHFKDSGTDVAVNSFHNSITELSGVATSSAFDVANSSGTEVTPAIKSGSITTTAANDVLVCYCMSDGWGTALKGAQVVGWRAMPGHRLISADRDIGYATMIGVQASAGAVNPAFYLADTTTGGDNFAVLSIALKASGGAGTPGSGTRIVSIAHTQVAQTTTAKVSAPVNGNLQVMLGAHGTGLVALSSVKGSGPGSYTQNTPTGNNPQIAYALNPSDDGTNVVTVASDGSGWPVVIYDCVSSGTWSFDKRATASGGATGGAGNITTTSVTPTSSGGIALMALRLTGPPDGISSPTGAVFDSVYYTGETDGSTMDIGEGYAHLTNAPASALSAIWHNTVATPDWDASAFVFNAASAGSVGSATAACTAAGVGASLATGAGSAAASCTAAGAGKALAAAAGSATVACSASAGGAALGVGQGVCAVVAAAAATSATLSAAAGAASVVCTAAGVGASLAACAGSSSVTATAAGTGAGPGVGVGAATAACTASGIGPNGSTGSSSVATACAGVGVALAATSGAASVVASCVATGSSLAASTGAASLACTALGVGAAVSVAVGASSCVATAAGVGAGVGPTAGTAAATATAAATGVSLAATTGSAGVACAANGFSPGGATGSCTASFACTATGRSLATCVGLALVVITVSGVSTALAQTVGASTVTCSASATGIGPGPMAGAATVACSATGASAALAAGTGVSSVICTASGSSQAGGSFGSATCTTAAAGAAAALAVSVGASSVACTALGIGASLAKSAGSATASFVAAGVAIGAVPTVGGCIVTVTAGAQSQSFALGFGQCVMLAIANAQSAAIAQSIGAAAVTCTAIGHGGTLIPPNPPGAGPWTKAIGPVSGAWVKAASPVSGPWIKNHCDALPIAA